MSRIGELFDKIIGQHNLPHDKALAELLEMEPCNLSRIRHDHRAVGPDVILRIHETFFMPIAEIKEALGIASLLRAPACRPQHGLTGQMLANAVVDQFRAGVLSQRKAAGAA